MHEETTPLHVYPVNDFREHILDGLTCWCKLVKDDGLVIHNAMDKREEYENGRPMC